MRLKGTKDVVKGVTIPLTHQKAAQTLTNWPVMALVSYKNQIVKTDRLGSHPQILEFYKYFQKELEKRGYPLFAFEFLRSNERQDILRSNGVSKAGAGQSPHNWGCAVDIVHSTLFWDLTPKQWAVIGVIGKEVARKRKIPIVWGGDWNFYDPAHWELQHWRELRSAQRALEKQGSPLPKDDAQRFAMLEAYAKAERS